MSIVFCAVLCCKLDVLLQNVEELAPLDQHLEKEHQEKTKVKNIEVMHGLVVPLCIQCCDTYSCCAFARHADSSYAVLHLYRLLSLEGMTLTRGTTLPTQSRSLLKRSCTYASIRSSISRRRKHSFGIWPRPHCAILQETRSTDPQTQAITLGIVLPLPP